MLKPAEISAIRQRQREHGSPPSCTASIDWVNFIQVGSTQYVTGPQMTPDALQESDLGPVYARVKFKVSGNVCDPTYKIKDGDAAFLDPGTPFYQSPATRLARSCRRGSTAASCRTSHTPPEYCSSQQHPVNR